MVRQFVLLLCVIVASGCRKTDDKGDSAAVKGGADKVATDKAAAEKAAAEKAAAEKAAADKAAADKAAADKAAAAKAAAQKAAAEKAAREKRVAMATVLDHMGKYLYENKLELTGGVGSGGSFTGGGRAFANYRDSLHDAAGADKAVRAVHAELWQLLDKRKWEAVGPRKLPDEKVFQFELRYDAGNSEGVIGVSFLPFDGKWSDKGKKAARLEVKVSEMPRKK